MDAVNLKISKLGGLSKTRTLRDVCVELDIPMTIEDSWGGDITTAAIAHLGAFHATAMPLQFHRFQRLCDDCQCRRCATTRRWNDDCVTPAGVGGCSRLGGVGRTGRGVPGIAQGDSFSVYYQGSNTVEPRRYAGLPNPGGRPRLWPAGSVG